MESIIPNFQEILGVPKFLINQITILPDYIRQAIIESLYFVPLLFVVYFIIEIIERFFMTHINLLVKLVKKTGPFFGVFISVLPECGFQVIASTYYARKLITRGTLMAFFISCSDDAYPILFLDLEKTNVIIPIIIIKILLGLIVWAIVDSSIIFMKKATEEVTAVNIDLCENACCHHKLTNSTDFSRGWGHPISHTINMFFFTAIALCIYYSAVHSLGSSENIANLLMYNSPVPIIGCAVFGLIPSCAASVFLSIAYIKGAISFSAFLAGLVTTTGVGLLALSSQSKKNLDIFLITSTLLLSAIIIGLIMSGLPVPAVPLFVK